MCVLVWELHYVCARSSLLYYNVPPSVGQLWFFFFSSHPAGSKTNIPILYTYTLHSSIHLLLPCFLYSPFCFVRGVPPSPTHMRTVCLCCVSVYFSVDFIWVFFWYFFIFFVFLLSVYAIPLCMCVCLFCCWNAGSVDFFDILLLPSISVYCMWFWLWMNLVWLWYSDWKKTPASTEYVL